MSRTKRTKEEQAAITAKRMSTLARKRGAKAMEKQQEDLKLIEQYKPEELSLDGIPDKEPPKRGRPRKVKYEQGHYVTDDEWLFLQMAKRMLRGVK